MLPVIDNHETAKYLDILKIVFTSNAIRLRQNTERRNGYIRNTEQQIRNAEHKTDNLEW